MYNALADRGGQAAHKIKKLLRASQHCLHLQQLVTLELTQLVCALAVVVRDLLDVVFQALSGILKEARGDKKNFVLIHELP